MAPFGYVVLYRPDHPLTGKTGLLLKHRMVLFDSIGPGAHPCNWCKTPVTWLVRGRGEFRTDELVVDHVDTNRTNNDLANLVPSCAKCNLSRMGGNERIVNDDEVFIVRSNGTRLRAVTVICANCSDPFLRAPSSIQEGTEPFCSRSCLGQYKTAQATHCKRGHLRSGDTLNNYGQCRACNRIAAEKWNVKKRERRAASRRGLDECAADALPDSHVAG